MALSQCDTTLIDLTIGGYLEEEFCSFRQENWSLSKCLSRSSSSSLEEGLLDETVIPVAAAKKRKSSEDISIHENVRKSSRIEAKMCQNTPHDKSRDSTMTPLHEASTDLPGDLDNTVLSGNLEVKKKLFSPIKFGIESIITSSSVKSGLFSKQKKKLQTESQPIDHTSTPLIIQPKGQKGKPALTAPSLAPTTSSLPLSVPKIIPETQLRPGSIKHTPVIENIGIFWDIENISIPSNVSVSDLVRRIRNTFVTADKREVEFMCVCDVHKENGYI